jgi:pyridoxamine 5'-phosphate oxidase
VPLLESKAPAHPLTLFRRWYREAEAAGAAQPDAIALATAGDEGPSVRMVLFKGIDDGSFLFYSNYASRKGRDLAQDNRAAITFYWFQTHHQVRVSGTVRRLSRRASLEYFRSRPRGAQLSALASRQSRPLSRRKGRGLPSREGLERAVAELAAKYPGDVPLPAEWGGYALRPRWIEFWESREDRLHDRLRYVSKRDGSWRIERLAP